MKKSNSRFLLLALLIFLAPVHLCGCGKGKPSDTSGTSSSTNSIEHRDMKKLQRQVNDLKAENNDLKAEIENLNAEIKELKERIKKGINRLILLGLLISLPLAILGIMTIIAILKSRKTIITTSPVGECPNCGWDLPPDTNECQNPDCKLRFK